jgi:alpha-tubulin suppressor-like RCC1 family protein
MHVRSPVTPRYVLSLLAASALAAACSDSAGPAHGPPAALAVISGDRSQATVGRASQPLVVQVRDAEGRPVPDVTVAWEVVAGAGSVSPASTVTNEQGRAWATLTLGTVAWVENVVRAQVQGLEAVTFTIVGGTDLPSQIEVVSGTGQATTVETPLSDSLVVVVRDAHGNLIRGAVVQWEVVAGGGSLFPPSLVTDSTGRAATTWTLGPEEGLQEARARTVVGTASATVTAAATPSLVSWVSITAGGSHSCGITSEGVSYCWGQGSVGQLGTGQPGNEAHSLVPVAVSGGHSFSALTAGQQHTCGLGEDRLAYCWGRRAWSPLGTNQLIPVGVRDGRPFSALSAGTNFSCAVDTEGDAYCWGIGGQGQLGDGAASDTAAAVAVAGGLSFTSVSAGDQHACGLTAQGAAYCWGRGTEGQLGDGATETAAVPVAVTGGHTFVAVSAGGRHSCALTAAGAAYCWGEGGEGRLGTGSQARSTVPAAVAGAHHFANLSAGYAHTCALTGGGAAYCWGRGSSGQLGWGSLTPTSTPAPVSGGRVYTMVSAGLQHSCAVTAEGAAYCWGQGQGRLGTGTEAHAASPARVRDP